MSDANSCDSIQPVLSDDDLARYIDVMSTPSGCRLLDCIEAKRARQLIPLHQAAKLLGLPAGWIGRFIARHRLKVPCAWNGREMLLDPAELRRVIIEKSWPGDPKPAEIPKNNARMTAATTKAPKQPGSVTLRELFRVDERAATK